MGGSSPAGSAGSSGSVEGPGAPEGTPPAAPEAAAPEAADGTWRELEEAEAVALCNRVLATAGLRATVASVQDVRVICTSTSLFVAACEALLGRKLGGIERRPTTPEQRAMNIDAVILELQDNVIKTSLSHISGTAVVAGELRPIRDLLELLKLLAGGSKPPTAGRGRRGGTPRRARGTPRRTGAADSNGPSPAKRVAGARQAGSSALRQPTTTSTPGAVRGGRGGASDQLEQGQTASRSRTFSPADRVHARPTSGQPRAGEKIQPAEARRVPFQPRSDANAEKPRILPETRLLDKELGKKVKDLTRLRHGSRDLQDFYKAAAARQAEETGKRVEARRRTWAKSRAVDRRMDARRAHTRRVHAERGLRHTAKVEGIKAQRFKDQMEGAEAARKARQVEHEATIFRNIFLEAVDREKERILDLRKEERQRHLGENASVAHKNSAAERKFMNHFRLLEEQYAQKQALRRQEERGRDLMQRELERDAKTMLEEHRRKLLLKVQHEQDTQYLRTMDPKLLRTGLLDHLTSELENKI